MISVHMSLYVALLHGIPLGVVQGVQLGTNIKMNTSGPVAPLKSINGLLNIPNQSIQHLAARMRLIEKQLTQIQKDTETELYKQKLEYEQQLEKQEDDLMELKHFNGNQTKRISQQLKENLKLRSQADDLTLQNTVLTRDLENLKANLSTAFEFASHELNSTEESLKASDVAVLAELDEKEKTNNELYSHKRRIEEITKPLSMLQIASQTTVGSRAARSTAMKELLESLATSVDDIKQQQDEGELSLKNDFQGRFDAGEVQRQRLIVEQANLNITLSNATALGRRLQTAVSYLRDVNHDLVTRVKSLHHYSKLLGSRPVPGVKSEEHVAKHPKISQLKKSNSALNEPKQQAAEQPVTHELAAFRQKNKV